MILVYEPEDDVWKMADKYHNDTKPPEVDPVKDHWPTLIWVNQKENSDIVHFRALCCQGEAKEYEIRLADLELSFSKTE